jgi:NAD(P)-dependent dehydrogenase (short-subunit alcohol dehydrogenase family)
MLIPDDFHALVIGSSGALGGAFVKHLRMDRRCQNVSELSRATHTGFDLSRPEDFSDLLKGLEMPAALSLIVDATGALSLSGLGPEKSLRTLKAAQLRLAMDVNAIGPMLLLSALMPLIKKSGRVLYIKLSARVGSISDNRKGGWYSYRSSKAALNMMLQSAALEWQRTNPAAQVIALQPGTVYSRLSKDYLQASNAYFTADESVQSALLALDKLQPKAGAQFVDYHGNSIPW